MRIAGSWMQARSERQSEDKGQKSEIRGQKSEVGRQPCDFGIANCGMKSVMSSE